MLTELTEELLDLTTTVRGYGAAVYAVEEDPGSCSNSSCCNSSIILCCSHICW